MSLLPSSKASQAYTGWPTWYGTLRMAPEQQTSGIDMTVWTPKVFFSRLDPQLAGQPTMARRAHTHIFEPYGLSAIYAGAKFWLALHTWPEHGALACDVAIAPSSGIEIETLASKIAAVLGLRVAGFVRRSSL